MADQKFIDEVLLAHNEYRAIHQAPPLRNSTELGKIAQNWADHLARTDGFSHSKNRYKDQHLGENIAMKWSSGPDNYTGQDCTDQWYSEIRMYEFGVEPSNLSAGHFTQVVWKGSEQIGVGRARTDDGKILVVCNYFPAGNMLRTFTDNVLPPKDGRIILPSKHKEQNKGSQSPKEEGLFSRRIQSKPEMSRQGESRSVRTFTETTGSGPNAVTKTIVEETIIKADGSKITNRKETTTTGGACASNFKSLDSGKDKDKDKKGGGFGTEIPISQLHIGEDADDFFKKKDKKKRSGSRSSSSSSDSSPERGENLKEFIENAVKTHNDLRKKHNSPPLKHAKDLSKYAQDWAEHLAKNNSFQHSNCTHKGGKLGENIACKMSSTGADYTGKEVTDYWYSEIKDHRFGGEPSGMLKSGHFTQVVWKGSEEMGIGKAKTKAGKCIVVASYRPAGNMIGSFAANVDKPR